MLRQAPPLVAGAKGKKMRWKANFVNDKKKESKANLLLGNERTFLGWFSSCNNLMGFGTGFITFFNAGYIFGAFLEWLAVLLIIYALILYLKRGTAIVRETSGPYWDPPGPRMFYALLMFATMMNSYYTFWFRPSLNGAT